MSCTWSPDVDVLTGHGSCVVRVDLPGVPPDAVRVEISDDDVAVAGDRPAEVRDPHDSWHETERAYGRFFRLIPLPAGAWPNRAVVTFGGGVLEIRVPIVLDDATELGTEAAVPAYWRGAA